MGEHKLKNRPKFSIEADRAYNLKVNRRAKLTEKAEPGFITARKARKQAEKNAAISARDHARAIVADQRFDKRQARAARNNP